MDNSDASQDQSCNDDTEVVLRRGSRHAQLAEHNLKIRMDELQGIKRVKWSESTDLRERMKEYRRSQLDLCLDYQHIAIDEEREREGVKQWRTKITSSDDDNDEEDKEEAQDGGANAGVSVDDDVADDDNNTDSEEEVTCCDEALEDRLRIIKARSSRITLQPAYAAAVQVYQEWLACTDNTSSKTEEAMNKMTSQLDIYKQILDLLGNLTDTETTDKIDSTYTQVTAKIGAAKQLGEPPEPVSKALDAELTKKENVDRQMEAYNSLVNDMVIAFSSGVMV